MNFKVGDRAQQKSAGPIMTVEALETAINGKAFVSRIGSEGANLQHRTFLPTDLNFAWDMKAAKPPE